MFAGLFGGKKDVLAVVEAALTARDWKYQKADDQTILTGFRAGSTTAVILFRNELGKKALLVMAHLLTGGDNPLAAMASGRLPFMRVHTNSGYSEQQVAKVCEYLLRKNYEFAIGAFERDPSDGEIRFRIGIPYRDGEITAEQIEWCVAMMADALAQLARELGDAGGARSSGMEI